MLTLVVEILSPRTINRDSLTKNLYERKGVKEYWLVSPEEKSVRQCTLENGRYTNLFIEDESITSTSIEGFSMRIDELFADVE